MNSGSTTESIGDGASRANMSLPTLKGSDMSQPASTSSDITQPVRTGSGMSQPASTSFDITQPVQTGSDMSQPAQTGSDMSHQDLMSLVRVRLTRTLSSDPLLSDLPACVTLAEVRSLVALEHGTAMAILVNRVHQKTRVIVEQSATVQDLKYAIQQVIALQLERAGQTRRINWRYVWRNNWLCFGRTELKDPSGQLKQLGLSNKSQVRFVKRYRFKRGQRHRRVLVDQ